jgi:hypothetical protein
VINSPRSEVAAVRLYSTTPGTERLRKSAASELRQMIAAGWQETRRTVHADHVLVRMERPVPKAPRMTSPRPGADTPVRRRG